MILFGKDSHYISKNKRKSRKNTDFLCFAVILKYSLTYWDADREDRQGHQSHHVRDAVAAAPDRS